MLGGLLGIVDVLVTTAININHVYGEGEEGMIRLGSKEKRWRCRRTSLIVPSHDDETNKSFLMLFQSTE